MKVIKIACAIALMLVINCLASCRKWLDKKPSTSLSTPETLKDLQAMLDNATFINFVITPSLPEASADDHFLLKSATDLSSQYSGAYTWETFVMPPSNDWRWCYIPIYNINVCLERLQDIPRTDANAVAWDNIKGSALFLRSYFFLQLLWAYSKAYDVTTANTDLGIALRTVSDFNVPSIRASIQECYDKIIQDTKESVSHLPDIPVHPMRPSKGAAYGMLARTYLSMRQYVNALNYSSLCLQINNQLINYNNDAVDIINDFNVTSSPFKRFNKETIFYTETNLNHPTGNPTYGKVDTMLYQQYSVDDLRKAAFFRADGGTSYHVFKGSYAQNTIVLFSGIATDEMYLTRAECLVRVGNNGTGDKDAAIATLDTLLMKRWKTGTYTSPVVSTSAEALKVILQERRKELIFRGLRWIDIKRLNKEGYGITPKRIIGGREYVLAPNDNRYALPLPQEIVDISGMPQNPR
jgi:starch-binding outer membrane protein, SusD/RagB family